MGRRLPRRLLRPGSARDRHRHGSVPRRGRLVLARRRPRHPRTPSTRRHPERPPRSSRRASANSPARATAPRSNCVPRGRRSSTTSPRTSRAGASCSACSPACLQQPRASRPSAHVGRPSDRAPRHRHPGGVPRRRRVDRRRLRPDRHRRRAGQRLPLLAARLPHPGLPPRRRSLPLRPAGDRRDDANSTTPSPTWSGCCTRRARTSPACARSGSTPPSSSTPNSPHVCSACPRVGLGTVVEELLGIHLAKEHSAADWSTRPLPASWLEYAALDVELLVDLRDALAAMLDDADKRGIAGEEFQATLDREAKAVRADPWRRLSGVHALRGQRSLAVARELWLARDALAQERDIAPGRLVPDASLVAVARAMPTTKRALADLREFTGRASRVGARALVAGRRVRPHHDRPSRDEADRRQHAASAPGLGRPEPRGRRCASRPLAPPSPSSPRSAPSRWRTCSRPTCCAAWPGRPRPSSTRHPSPTNSPDSGARPWQVAATSQVIADAFVEADQEPDASTEAPS